MICIPVMAGNCVEAHRKMEWSFPLSDLVELRMDYMQPPDLKDLLKEHPERILVTNRRKEEGGGFTGMERERVGLLQEAVRQGAGYVDLELSTEETLMREFIETIRETEGRTQWIGSFHAFNGSISRETLQKKLEEGVKKGADVVKIVPYARTMEDNLKVLTLIPYARKRGQTIIAFCMGEKGKISRVMAHLLGSYLTYVSIERGEETAPGQLTLREFQTIMERIGPSHGKAA